jgi:hypothetical protein
MTERQVIKNGASGAVFDSTIPMPRIDRDSSPLNQRLIQADNFTDSYPALDNSILI